MDCPSYAADFVETGRHSSLNHWRKGWAAVPPIDVSLSVGADHLPKPTDKWDIFVSHASEDKDAFARPLAEALRAAGLRVWYDEFSLRVGDSLHKTIDQGLSNSRFGVVILSPYFFDKHWPRTELNGLATREVGGQKVILPVWLNVDFKEVCLRSPILADRIAVNADKGIPHVVEKLLEAISPGPSPEVPASTRETADYVRNLESLLLARTDQLQSATSSLERSFDLALETLADVLDLRHAAVKGNSRRTTIFTIAIAKVMGVSREEIATIARAALVHDIGKIGVPDDILRKPGKLTPAEIEVMRDHARRGYDMLRKIPFLKEAAEVVHAHQEHFDGTGYPRGLKGQTIPLGARIFSVADTLNAMTTDLPYRPARSFQAAREEIQRWSGRQFDPIVVKAFLTITDKTWEDLDEATEPSP